MTKKKEDLIITILCLMIFLLGFLLANRIWFRLDMTHDKSYTLSEFSRNLYLEIPDRISITYFVSSRLSSSYPVPGEIADMLREFAAHSRGRIHFIQRDPSDDGLSRIVENLGILPWQIQVTERNEITHATVYSGILIEYLDREEIIPLVFSLDTLEYDLSSRIMSLVRNNIREVGIITGDPMADWYMDYSLLNYALVLSGFRPLLLAPGISIPFSLPCVFVLGGMEYLDEYHLSPIDEYIMSGGNVLFALNGVHVDAWGSLDARPVYDRGILAMLANYGVILHRVLVLDRASLNLTFQTHGEDGTRIQSVRYPPWIAVQETGINQEHPLSVMTLGPDFFWPSPLELLPPPGISADVLYKSSREAWLQTHNFITNPNFVSQFEDERALSQGEKILALALWGNFPSAFETEYVFAHRPSRMVVIGDVNFAGSLMQTTQSEDRNLEILVRSAIWLSGEDELLSLRTGSQSGRLDRILDADMRAAFMSFSRMLNTFIIPLLVILSGIIIIKSRSSSGRSGRKKDRAELND